MKNLYIFFTILLIVPILVASPDQGYIYGKVTTFRGESYTGALRWGTQECFWDDLFNAEKTKNEYAKKASKNGLFKTYFTLHQFVTRFGDMEQIVVKGAKKVRVRMKNGNEYLIKGWGDVGADIKVLDEELGELTIDWDKIDTIEFMKTPNKIQKMGIRLKGKVNTREGEFAGFIMWDNEECLDTDILDGDSEDGRMKIKFRNIKSIERNSYHSSKIITKSGRKVVLRGTNDVNSENRGIVIEDERYGRVEVPWNEFKILELEDNTESGKSYNSYKPTSKLWGTVEVYKDKARSGQIVFDYDEAEGFEILNGKISDIEFYIPFSKVRSITPKTRHSSVVVLTNGEELILGDSQDVSDSNTGIIVFADDGEQYHISWGDVEKITFEHK